MVFCRDLCQDFCYGIPLCMTLKREESDKVSRLKLFRIVKEKLSAKSCRGSNGTVFLHNKMVGDVNKCKMMHRRKARQFICTVTQYYGPVISRDLGVILDGSMKMPAQWQSSK